MGVQMCIRDSIISAAGTLLAAYFAYNQYTKNKLTDLKVEYFKKEEERRSYHRSEKMCIRDRDIASTVQNIQNRNM